MCFYHDYDWTASISEDVKNFVTKVKVKCEECRDYIHPGQSCRYVYMQEHEECQICEVEDGINTCEETSHDYGEIFECFICIKCQALLDAIEEIEQEAGCSYPDSQPAFGQLREAIQESDHVFEYIELASKRNPDLVASGHLDRFYRLIVDDCDRWPLSDLDPVEVYGGEG